MKRTLAHRVLGVVPLLGLFLLLALLVQQVQGSGGSPLAGTLSATLTKTDSPDPVCTGGDLTYSLDVVNAGTPITNVLVTDHLPAEVTFVSASAPDFDCALNGQDYVCSRPAMAPGFQTTIELVVTVDSGFLGSLTNEATVISDNEQPYSATATTDVVGPELQIVKTDDPDPVLVGGALAYTILVTNAGQCAATGVLVDDDLPTDVQYESDSPSQGDYNHGSGQWDVGDLDASESASLVINVTVKANAQSPIVNTAQMGSQSAEATTAVNASADLEIAKAASEDPVTAGMPLTYTLVVTNHGPSQADSVEVIDTLPPDTTLVSSDPACTAVGHTVTCQAGTLNVGSSATWLLRVNVDPAAHGTLTNNAEVSSAVHDPGPYTNDVSLVTGVVAEADLEIDKTASDDPVAAGSPLAYTLVVENHGPSDAHTVTVIDTLPLSTTLVSSDPACSAAGNVVTCDANSIDANGSAEWQLDVLVDPAAGGTLTNVAKVSSLDPDPGPATNVVTLTTGVVAEADLEITKSASPYTATAGLPLDYTIVVTNHGPSHAAGLQVVDTLPLSTTLVSSDPGCDAAGGTVTCTLDALGTGDSATWLLSVDVDQAARISLTNVAEVSSTAGDPGHYMNVATLVTPVVAEADLEVVKSDAPDPVVAGTTLTYTFAITNHGPSLATGVQAVDTLPISVTFSWADPPPSAGPVPLEWHLGKLTPGARVQVTVVVTTDNWISATLDNIVTVRAIEPDTGAYQSTDTEPTTVKPLCSFLQVTATGAGIANTWPTIGGLGAETRVGYLSDRTGNEELFVSALNAVESPRQATSSPPGVTNEFPAISGDGRRLAFVSDGSYDPQTPNPDAGAELYVYDIPSGAFQNVTGQAGSVFPGAVLAPSADDRGGRIAFASDYDLGQNPDGNIEIWAYDGANAPFRKVGAGTYHTCGVRTGGSLACWGNNDYGQSSVPAGVFTQVGAGWYHTCGLRADDTLACWGDNSYGQSSPPADTFTQVSTGYLHTCGRRTDGTLACWGYDYMGQASPPAGTFAGVSAGWYHTCGVASDGTAACWGYNYYGQASPPGGVLFTQVTAGGFHSCGVRTDLTLICWGDNSYGQASPPAGTFAQVSAGYIHTCGLRTDGTLACWGLDNVGQSSPPAGTFTTLSTGFYHACGVRTDGTLACWGWNGYGQASPPVAERRLLQVTGSTQATSAHAALSGNAQYVAFLSDGNLDVRGGNEDGNTELFAARLDAESIQPVQLTHTAPGIAVESPSISYDGARIAFLSNGNLAPGAGNPDDNLEVFYAELNLAALTGTVTLTQVTATGAGIVQADPALSGDGRTIAFISNGELDPERDNGDLNPEVYLAALGDAGAFIQVTDTGPDVANSEPSINYLGSQIAFVSDGDLQPSRGNSEGNLEVFVSSCGFRLPAARLAVQKVGPFSTWEGATIPYSLVVTNPGRTTAYGLVFTDWITGSAIIYPGDARCEENGSSEIACHVGKLAPGETVSLTVWALVQAGPELVNTVEVYALNSPSPVSDTIHTLVGDFADVSVVKTASGEWVDPGEPLTYTVLIQNNPATVATVVLVTDTIAASVGYATGTVTLPGGDCGEWQGDTITCTVPSLAPGATVTLTLIITPQQTGDIVNTARVAGDASLTDPNMDNNVSSVTNRGRTNRFYLPLVLKGG